MPPLHPANENAVLRPIGPPHEHAPTTSSAPPPKPRTSLADLDADTPSALLVVDVQRDWYSQSVVSSEFPELAHTLPRLIGHCRQAQMPVVHVRAKYDTDAARHMAFFKRLNPEKPAEHVSPNPEPFAAEEPGELVVYKPTFDGFHETELADALHRMGVKRVYVCGLVTSACVLNTCFGAFRHGFEVVLVPECCGDRVRAQHDAVVSIYDGYTFVGATLVEVLSLAKAQPAPRAPISRTRSASSLRTTSAAASRAHVLDLNASGCAEPARSVSPEPRKSRPPSRQARPRPACPCCATPDAGVATASSRARKRRRRASRSESDASQSPPSADSVSEEGPAAVQIGRCAARTAAAMVDLYAPGFRITPPCC